MDQLITTVMVLFIGVIGIGVALSVGTPIITKTISGNSIDDAKSVLGMIDNAVLQVAEEGNGSTRTVSFYSTSDGYTTIPEEDAISINVLGNFMDYGTRSLTGDMMTVAGDECDCYLKDANNDGKKEIVMENDRIIVLMQNVSGSINASRNVLAITNKITNVTIPMAANTVAISGRDVSIGTGYMQLIAEGISRPLCKTAVFVTSQGISYKIIYTLYTGADFVDIDTIV